MDKIDKQARLLHKSLKGEITVPAVIKYLERYGYNTVFFKSDKEGDFLLSVYGITPGETKAFTYCGNTKLVFIDGTLHVNDMLYSILHECGHIVLEHIGNNDITLLGKRLTENEAEAFAYAALHYQSRSFARKIRTALSALYDSVISLFIRAEERKHHADKPESGSMEKIPCEG